MAKQARRVLRARRLGDGKLTFDRLTREAAGFDASPLSVKRMPLDGLCGGLAGMSLRQVAGVLQEPGNEGLLPAPGKSLYYWLEGDTLASTPQVADEPLMKNPDLMKDHPFFEQNVRYWTWAITHHRESFFQDWMDSEADNSIGSIIHDALEFMAGHPDEAARKKINEGMLAEEGRLIEYNRTRKPETLYTQLAPHEAETFQSFLEGVRASRLPVIQRDFYEKLFSQKDWQSVHETLKSFEAGHPESYKIFLQDVEAMQQDYARIFPRLAGYKRHRLYPGNPGRDIATYLTILKLQMLADAPRAGGVK